MNKTFLYAINLLLVAALLFNAVNHHFFSNTFGVEKLVFSALSIGIVSGIIISYFYIKRKAIEDTIERTQITMILCLALAFFSVSVSINLNYLVYTKHSENLQIVDIQAYYTSRTGLTKNDLQHPTGYNVFVIRNGKKERLRYTTLTNYEDAVGKTHSFDIQHGILGFDAVKHDLVF